MICRGRYAEDDIRLAIDLYLAGASSPAIAARLGRSVSAVDTLLSELRRYQVIEPRTWQSAIAAEPVESGDSWSQDAVDRLVRLVRADYQPARIAELMGRTRAAISQRISILRRAGLLDAPIAGDAPILAPPDDILAPLYGARRYEDDPRALRDCRNGTVERPATIVETQSSAEDMRRWK